MSEDVTPAQATLLLQKMKNLEDMVREHNIVTEARLARLENSPGAQGSERLTKLEERLDAIEGDGEAAEVLEIATLADLAQMRDDADKNYVAGPAYAKLESRVAELEKAGEKPATTPKTAETASS